MFNTTQKEAFIKEYSANQKELGSWESIFNAIESYEADKNMDICFFEKEDLQKILDELIAIRSYKNRYKLTTIQSYIQWCIKNVPGSNPDLKNLDVMGVSKIKQQLVPNPVALQKYLNDIYEPEENQTIDNVYRCFYWFAYSGIREEDILNIRATDINYEYMEIMYEGKRYPIYRESLPCLRNCVNLTAFLYKHPNYSAGHVVVRPRMSGDVVIRGIKSAYSINSLRVALSKRANDKINDGTTNIKMSYYKAWLSGIFFREYEKELLGKRPDFYEVIMDITEGKSYKLDSGRNTLRSKKNQMARDLIDDYDRWKLAFNL